MPCIDGKVDKIVDFEENLAIAAGDKGTRQHYTAGIPATLRHSLTEMGATLYIVCHGFVAYRLGGGGFLLMQQDSYDKVVYMHDDPFYSLPEALHAHWQAADPIVST